jgi:hypothetical protein
MFEDLDKLDMNEEEDMEYSSSSIFIEIDEEYSE